MKKIFCLLLIGGLFVAFTSCTKTCDCKEKITGLEYNQLAIKAGAYKAYSTCKQLQNGLNEGNEDQSWSCK